MNATEIEQIFAEYGLDPDIHFDGSVRTGGAEGLVGKYSESELRSILAGAPAAAYTNAGTSTTTSPGGAYTEADVAAWFRAAGVTIATETEKEPQRLARIAQQLNAGMRTEAEVRAAILGIAEGTVGFDPNAPIMYGGAGSAAFQAITGGNAEIWGDGQGSFWMVYGVPGTDVVIYYDVSDPTALFPAGEGAVTLDRTITETAIQAMGGLYGGVQEEIALSNPYIQFIQLMETELAINPALQDPDIFAETFMSILEGRPVNFGSIAQTQWWLDNSDVARSWLTLLQSDPATAAQLLEAGRIDTYNLLESLGMSTPPDDIVNWLSDQRVTGLWSDEKYRQQLRAIADPQSGLPIDPALAAMIGGRSLDTARQYEERVRSLVAQWLGPLYGEWSQSQITYWAGRFRNDPDATEELTEVLRGQRMALFPEYDNQNLTYEDIAGPWRNMWQGTWGQVPDERDPLFYEVLRLNDFNEAGKVLREEGLSRGIPTVMQSLEDAALSTGNQIRRNF